MTTLDSPLIGLITNLPDAYEGFPSCVKRDAVIKIIRQHNVREAEVATNKKQGGVSVKRPKYLDGKPLEFRMEETSKKDDRGHFISITCNGSELMKGWNPDKKRKAIYEYVFACLTRGVSEPVCPHIVTSPATAEGDTDIQDKRHPASGARIPDIKTDEKLLNDLKSATPTSHCSLAEKGVSLEDLAKKLLGPMPSLGELVQKRKEIKRVLDAAKVPYHD